MTDAVWQTVADAAGVHPPSDTTREQVIELFAARERPADPFDRLDDYGWAVMPRDPGTPRRDRGTAADGWLYQGEPVPSSQDSGDMVLVVSDDGYVRGVVHYDRAPLAALLRIDA